MVTLSQFTPDSTAGDEQAQKNTSPTALSENWATEALMCVRRGNFWEKNKDLVIVGNLCFRLHFGHFFVVIFETMTAVATAPKNKEWLVATAWHTGTSLKNNPEKNQRKYWLQKNQDHKKD